MKKKIMSDNKKCKKCGGRTALVSGQFYYNADQEPYKNGVIERAERPEGDEYVHGLLCDKCGRLTQLWQD